MTVWIKQGVVGDPSREMLRARGRLHQFYQHRGYDLFVTSTRDGNHSAGSFHYRGDAEDYRYPPSGKFSKDEREAVKQVVGQGYDIVFHNSHIHIEWDPK